MEEPCRAAALHTFDCVSGGGEVGRVDVWEWVCGSGSGCVGVWVCGCAMCNVQCAMCMYSTMCNVQCAMCIVQCAVCRLWAVGLLAAGVLRLVGTALDWMDG